MDGTNSGEYLTTSGATVVKQGAFHGGIPPYIQALFDGEKPSRTKTPHLDAETLDELRKKYNKLYWLPNFLWQCTNGKQQQKFFVEGCLTRPKSISVRIWDGDQYQDLPLRSNDWNFRVVETAGEFRLNLRPYAPDQMRYKEKPTGEELHKLKETDPEKTSEQILEKFRHDNFLKALNHCTRIFQLTYDDKTEEFWVLSVSQQVFQGERPLSAKRITGPRLKLFLSFLDELTSRPKPGIPRKSKSESDDLVPLPGKAEYEAKPKHFPEIFIAQPSPRGIHEAGVPPPPYESQQQFIEHQQHLAQMYGAALAKGYAPYNIFQHQIPPIPLMQSPIQAAIIQTPPITPTPPPSNGPPATTPSPSPSHHAHPHHHVSLLQSYNESRPMVPVNGLNSLIPLPKIDLMHTRATHVPVKTELMDIEPVQADIVTAEIYTQPDVVMGGQSPPRHHSPPAPIIKKQTVPQSSFGALGSLASLVKRYQSPLISSSTLTPAPVSVSVPTPAPVTSPVATPSPTEIPRAEKRPPSDTLESPIKKKIKLDPTTIPIIRSEPLISKQNEIPAAPKVFKSGCWW